MKLTLSVNVRPSSILRARMVRDKNCGTCPIAVELLASTGQKWGVSRSGAYCKKFGRVEWEPRVTKWIDDYDAGRKVGGISFSFPVDVPS
jgi:hypothetical protein